MKTYIKKHKYHFIILAVLLVIIGVSGYYTFKIPSDKQQIPNNTQNTNEKITNKQQFLDKIQQTTEITSTTSTPLIENKVYTTEQASTTSIEISTGPITNYKLKADSYNLTSTTTVYELMQFASADSHTPFLFTTKEFSGLGYFVESINGLKNDPQAGKYWIYYLNGESAQVGISNQIVKSGDIVEWKYESSNF